MFTPIAILFSAFLGLVAVAVHGVIAQKRAAMDLLLKIRTDSDHLKADLLFRQLQSDEQVQRIFNPKKADRNDQTTIKNYLNTYELICCSIKRHVIDEGLCRELIGQTIIRRWTAIEEFVQELRIAENDNNIFCEFEDIAKTWKDGRLYITNNKILDLLKGVLIPPRVY